MNATLLDIQGLKDRTTVSFRSALVQLSEQMGFDPSYLAAVLYIESGFDPSIFNRLGAPAVGLNQFWRDFFPPIASRAESLFPGYARRGVRWEDLPSLSAVEQLPFVMSHFRGTGKIGPGSSPTDYYLANFMPAFVGAPASTVLGRKGSNDTLLTPTGKNTGLSLGKIYTQNAGLDVDGNGEITVADIGKKIESVVAAARKRPPLEVELIPLARSFLPAGAPSPVSPSSRSGATSLSDTRDATAPRTERHPTITIGSPAPVPANVPRPNTLTPRVVSSIEVFLPPISAGAEGPAVQFWQRVCNVHLARMRQALLLVDGRFGPKTAAATLELFGSSTVDRFVWNAAGRTL